MTPRLLLRFGLRVVAASILVYAFVFLAFAVLPLDPARAVLGPMADTSAVEALNARYGFDRPVIERFVRVATGLLRGDFGVSITWGRPVGDLLASSLATTLARLLLALALGLALVRVLLPITVARDLNVVSAVWMAVAGVPGFIALVLTLAFFGSAFALPPSTNRWLYEALAVGWVAIFTSAMVGLSMRERLEFRQRRSRQAEFLLHLRAPPRELVQILLRGAWPTAFAATANAATGALTTLAFAEYVFGLPGFSITYFRACESGDVAVVCFGSLFLAWCLLAFHMCAEMAARWNDRRLA